MKKTVKESAVEVRKVLKATYPDTKFSVQGKSFAGGWAVYVHWTDGPTESEVREVTMHLKGWENGFYNEYISVSRGTSLEAMTAAARAAAEHYGIAMPNITGDNHPYVTDYTVINGEAICDLVHRAAWRTSLYGVKIEQAFAKAY